MKEFSCLFNRELKITEIKPRIYILAKNGFYEPQIVSECLFLDTDNEYKVRITCYFLKKKTSLFFYDEYVVCKEEKVYDAQPYGELTYEKWLTHELKKHFKPIDYRKMCGHTLDQTELKRLHVNIDKQVGKKVKSKFWPTHFKNPASISDLWIDQMLYDINIEDSLYDEGAAYDDPPIHFKPRVNASVLVCIDVSNEKPNICFCFSFFYRRYFHNSPNYSVFTIEQSNLSVSINRKTMHDLPKDYLIISNTSHVSKKGDELGYIEIIGPLADLECEFNKKVQDVNSDLTIDGLQTKVCQSNIFSDLNFLKKGDLSFLNKKNSRDLFSIIKNEPFKIIAMRDILMGLSGLNKKLSMIACLFLVLGILPGIFFWIYKENLLNKKMSIYITELQASIPSHSVNKYTTGPVNAR